MSALIGFARPTIFWCAGDARNFSRTGEVAGTGVAAARASAALNSSRDTPEGGASARGAVAVAVAGAGGGGSGGGSGSFLHAAAASAAAAKNAAARARVTRFVVMYVSLLPKRIL